MFKDVVNPTLRHGDIVRLCGDFTVDNVILKIGSELFMLDKSTGDYLHLISDVKDLITLAEYLNHEYEIIYVGNEWGYKNVLRNND